jgi:hypothetical protein
VSNRRVEADGVAYELRFEPVRTSLSDSAPMLWGFQVFVLKDGVELGMKTCFVGRVSVQFRDKGALEGTRDNLTPVLHDLATEKIVARLAEGETGDEILFA